MWHILNSFPDHFATFVDYPPISILYTNISSPDVLMPNCLPKLRSNHLTNTIIPLSLRLKCHGYEPFSFFSNSGVCTFICADVHTSCLPQFDLLTPSIQLIWLKISLPNTSKFICTLYRLRNSTNREMLFVHVSKSIDTITLHFPRSEINILDDFNVHNLDWLAHSSNFNSSAGLHAEAFAIVKDLSQLISKPTHISDCSGDKANTLDLCLTLNPDIYANPAVDSALGNSDHCLTLTTNNFGRF